ILAVVCFYIAIWLPAASFYEGQEAFAATLGLVPQIVLASLVGYLVGQLLNAWIMNAMKKRSGEGGLKTRLIASTVVGEFGDTLLFCAIAASVIGVDSVGGFYFCDGAFGPDTDQNNLFKAQLAVFNFINIIRVFVANLSSSRRPADSITFCEL